MNAHRRGLLLALLIVVLVAGGAAAQVIMRPGGNNPGGATVIEPTFEPPYRLTISVYVTGQDGRPLPPPLGANVLLIDPQGRRVGMDEAGKLFGEVPKGWWAPVQNPQPNAPVGPRGLAGSGVTIEEPADGPYVVEIAGTERVLLDVAVAQWDRAGRRRWLHLSRGATEPGAVDRWDFTYTAAARPPFEVRERPDHSYLSLRAYGTRGAAARELVAELLLTDPRGRRVGTDPRTRKTYQELPRASYDSGTGDDDEARELELTQLRSGDYGLDVIGIAAGRYEFTLYATGADGQSRTPLEVTGVPTVPGIVHRYVLAWPATADGPVTLGGGWGRGARLLTYAYPLGSRTVVPAGGALVVVFYDRTIVPGTLKATLDGHDVSTRFRPMPGGHEAVRLPVAIGRHTLVLSVQGAVDGRPVTHTDALELVSR